MEAATARHVVFFTDCPYFGGAEAYIAMLAQACPGPGWRLSALVPEGERGEVLALKLSAAGVQVVRYPVSAVLHPKLWLDVGRALRRLRGDILHMNLPSVYDSRLSVPAVLAKAAGYRRVVTTEHLPMVLRARRRMLLKLLLAPAVDAIIVHTEWNRNILASYHHMPKRKMAVIPNGSPEAPAMSAAARETLRVGLGLEAGEIALAIVARLTERKGHRILFEALAELGRQGLGSSWRLWVVGEGEEEAALRQQAAACGLAARISFLGYREDAREIIHASDALLLPSMLETQPLVLTEAMASARPVLASRIYGIPEIVEEGCTGLLVPPAEVMPLAAALARMLRDPALRAELGAAGRRRYEEHFTLAAMAARTFEVLAG